MKRPRCPRRPRLPGLRASATAVVLSAAAWAAGCATPQPMMEPFFQQRSYTPARIALLPPTVFMVLDEVGDNDPAKSMQLGQAVTQQTVSLIADELRRRGYDVNLQARWDGIFDGGGQLLVPANELAWLANSIVQFANSETGGGEGPMKAPAMIAPELARKVGWATQSDALMYVNMKGVAVSSGKRTAQIVGVVFFVVVIAAIIALLVAQSKGGGGKDVPAGSTAGAGRAVPRAGGATAAAPVGGAALAGAGRPTAAVPVGAAPVGRGRAYGSGGGHVYRAAPGPRFHSGVHVGVGVMVPLDSSTHTHDGQVADEDETFAGDEIHVSMTLVSAHDGRVLWHIRDSVDVAPDKPHEVEQFVRKYVGLIPPSLAPGTGPAAAAAPTAAAPAP
jgi:hypothetical protein